MENGKENRLFIALLFALAFILLREWLILIADLTDTGHLGIFLVFIAGSLLLSLFRLKWPWILAIQSAYVIWALHVIFLDTVLPRLQTIAELLAVLGEDIPAVFTGNFDDTTNVIRTLGFFLFLWMLVYLVKYWILVKNRIFLFYFTTIVLIATADTFSPYSASGSVFILMIVGLLLLGLLYAFRVEKEYAASFSMGKVVQALLPLILLLTISSLLISFLPKFSPKWADPVPFIQSVVDDGSGTGPGISKSGYDPNDSQLGGPFLEDDSLVFEAVVKGKQYWKIETKDIYTSKGWEASELNIPLHSYQLGEAIQTFPTIDEEEEIEVKLADLTMTEKFPFVIYPYGLSLVDSDQEVTLLYDETIEKYATLDERTPFSLDSYHVLFAEDQFSLKALRETKMEDYANGPDLERFLQLPENLPERVGELAANITESSESVYDKAKAIERYFSRSGFSYDRKNVAIPEEDDDYVDQFLFDTKKGYCDNFSTSMVVLLRSIDIPARWVKGFAPGELNRNEAGEQFYRVSNNEAHSWVEAYMPSIGWMPFEPTIGFNGVASIDYDIDLSIDDPEVQEAPEEVRKEIEQREEKQNEQEAKKKEKPSFTLFSWGGDGGVWRTILLIAVLASGVLIYLKRSHWMPHFMIRRYRLKTDDWTAYAKAYMQLVKQLERVGIQRQAHETLATFAKRVDEYYGISHMQRLTTAYEKGLYAEAEEIQEREVLNELWTDLFKRTTD